MKKTLLCLLTLFFPFLLKSQVWTKPDAGIPSQNVTSIALDSSGKIWIGSQSGLAAFEGNQWKSYNLNNSSYNWDEISKVWTTKDSIWVGTEYNGLWGFNGVNKWTHYDPNSSGNGIVGFGKDSKGVL